MKKANKNIVTVLAALLLFACEEPEHPPGQSEVLSPVIGILKTVPAGRFQRDADSNNVSVISRSFLMSRYEITRSQFTTVVGNDPVLMLSSTANSSGTGDPVMQVNWYHAIAFCNKLSLRENLEPVYTVVAGGVPVDWDELTYMDIPINANTDWNNATADWTKNGYRLPTEMEWMWAAMGAPADGRDGQTNRTGWLKAYAGSTEGAGTTYLGNYTWYKDNSGNKTHPTGKKAGNELALFDLSGNVFEYCWDWWLNTSLPGGELTDYRGPASGTYRVTKGGAWSSLPDHNATTITSWSNPRPEQRNTSTGFRVVRW